VPVEPCLVSWVTVDAPAILPLVSLPDVPPLVALAGADFPSTVVVPVPLGVLVVAPFRPELVAGSDFIPSVLLSSRAEYPADPTDPR
jgi:hypothetical protein